MSVSSKCVCAVYLYANMTAARFMIFIFFHTSQKILKFLQHKLHTQRHLDVDTSQMGHRHTD
ncbi:hypothetical protein RHMOL_Rhmol01G0146500 [Rhododendron molle]|uniref:Uncharacterized protein n=1 Tax=Rhododendron molle TaxID=49168 RepID=A0ACC0Q182_RHOML|nr:hypothetical protein RHMOL_Rhmol01G0146500 [Rhododendron molle]